MNYFKPNETSCKCGCGFNITPKMLSKINEIREAWRLPLVVNSGARCQAYNQSLRDRGYKAAVHSNHLKGLAVDLSTADPTKLKEFQEWLVANAERFNIWLESNKVTTTWAHVQLVPYPSWVLGKSRVFLP